MDEGDDNLVTVATFADAAEATLARDCLATNGIRAHVAEENVAGLGWIATGAGGGAKLLVAEKDAVQAATLLEERPWLDSEDPVEADPHAIATKETVKRINLAEREGMVTPHTLEQLSDDDEEEDRTRREQQAARAIKSVVIGILFWTVCPPLFFLMFLPYTVYLLIDVWTSRQRLEGAPRVYAVLAGMLVAALGIATLLIFLLAGRQLR